ncbi:capping complex subunit for YIEGIA [Paenibacillus sp. GCM10023250]|uniref:capping complex subunit for YIEGIA n=1 Tax=Paenibacillus sp. GCM10023250 TaxID=3252648 RepID=UPI00361B6A30
MAKIVAIVTDSRDRVGGGAPIFVESDKAKRESTAFLLEKILDAIAHDMKDGNFLLVDHSAE